MLIVAAMVAGPGCFDESRAVTLGERAAAVVMVGLVGGLGGTPLVALIVAGINILLARLDLRREHASYRRLPFAFSRPEVALGSPRNTVELDVLFDSVAPDRAMADGLLGTIRSSLRLRKDRSARVAVSHAAGHYIKLAIYMNTSSYSDDSDVLVPLMRAVVHKVLVPLHKGYLITGVTTGAR